jgi:hypothetical protein
MQAISIRQPWAWAILHAGKNIENRRWSWHYQGEFAIHAPATLDPFDDRWPRSVPKPELNALPLRAFVGVADLEKMVDRSRSRWFEGPIGWVLTNPRPLRQPITYLKGNSRVWNVPSALARSIRLQLDSGERLMRHFIAYHNTEKMGRSLSEGEPLRLLTNKHVNHLVQNTVWFITGEGSDARQFSLGSVFCVAEVGEAAEDGFKRFAAGPGHVFEPPIQIKEMPWFPEVLRATGHFGLGVQEVKDEAVITGLVQLAAQAGYEIS